MDPYLVLTAGKKMSLDKKAYKFKLNAEKLFWTLFSENFLSVTNLDILINFLRSHCG